MNLLESPRLRHSGVENGVQWVTLDGPIGSVNGYVKLPAGHPWLVLDLQFDDISVVDVHGGITYGPEDNWIGFDTAHHGDYWPDQKVGTPADAIVRWTPAMVDAEAMRLARQAAAVVTQLTEGRHEAARHVLWHIGDVRGYQPGSFTEKLLETWAHADQDNSSRLREAFPLLGGAVEAARNSGSAAVAAYGGIE